MNDPNHLGAGRRRWRRRHRRRAAKRLPKGCRIVLVEREERHLFAPSLLWLCGPQRRSPGRLTGFGRKESRSFAARLSESIQPAATVAGIVLRGDFIVIALGAELAPELVPGLAEAGHNFYQLAGAESLRDALKGFRSGRLIVLTAT